MGPPPHPSPTDGGARRHFLVALGVVVLSTLIVATLLVIPSPRVVDEHVYHLMVKSAVEGSPWHILNGDDVAPSPELQIGRPGSWLHVREVGGKLVAQYPPLYALLCVPLYLLGGMSGIFWFNILCFGGVLLLCYGITRKLGGDPPTALLAPILLIVATPAWRLSISMLPHAAALLFIVGAQYLILVELEKGQGGRGWEGVGAGLMLGLGCHMRLDSILVLPALFLPLMWPSGRVLRRSFMVMVGLLPPLLLLSYLQHLRFGVWNPFTYGGNELKDVIQTESFPLLTRLHTLYLNWIDPREPGVAPPLAWLRRTGQGALLFQGVIQFSLLQTCPWLAGLWVGWRGSSPRGAVPGLVAPVVVVGGVMAWIGLNAIRYQMPIFPGLAVVAALVLQPHLHPRGIRWMFASGIGVFLLFVFHRQLPWYYPGDDVVSHGLPLCLAAAALVGGVGLRFYSGWGSRMWWMAMGGALVWAAALNFDYHIPREREERQERLDMTRRFEPHIPEKAMILGTWSDPCFGLVEGRHLIVVDPRHDNWQDLPRLLSEARQRDLPVFSAFEPLVWEQMRGEAPGLGWRVEVEDISRGWVLARWEVP